MKAKTIEANNRKFARLKELHDRVIAARAILKSINDAGVEQVFLAAVGVPDEGGANQMSFVIELTKPMVQQQAVYMVMHAERDFKEAGGEL